MEYKNSEANPEERLPWKRPEVIQLTINLNTNASPGSGINLDFADAE